MTATALTWSTTHKYGSNSLAHQFPSFQIGSEGSGNVRVEAKSPSGRIMDMSAAEASGVYTANFTPTEVGDWIISILFEGKHIHGSPFHVRVYDASQVKVFGLEGGTVGRMFSFSVDCTGAGDGELAIDILHNGVTIPAQIEQDSSRSTVYKVNFTPPGSGQYTIRVYFAGMEIAGSPFTLDIIDSSMIFATGDSLQGITINKQSSFVINTSGSSGGEVKVNITSPSQRNIPCQIVPQSKDSFRVDFTSYELGDHIVNATYYGKPIKGSPFHIQAIDLARIRLTNLSSQGYVNKMVEFDIDTMNAGSGNLEIMVNDGTIPCSVHNRGNRQFHATFQPKDAIPHMIQMKFNSKEVPGSPWRVDIRGTHTVSLYGNGIQRVRVGQKATIELKASENYSEGEVSANVTSSIGMILPVRIINQFNGTYLVEYSTTEIGNHTVDLQFDGQPVSGSPFIVKSYNVNEIAISNVPPAVIGKQCEFTIDVTQAGEGQLEIMVNRGSVPNNVKLIRKGVFQVTFVPMDSRVHVVDVTFNGDTVQGCPINVYILDASRVTVQGEMNQAAVNKASIFRVNTATAGAADLNVRVTAPNGDLVPAKLALQPDGDYKVEYSSKYTGRHTVEVLYSDQPIMGSPFYVEIYDPQKIIIDGMKHGMVGETVSFDINRQEAGKAEIGLSIISPTGKSVPYEIQPTFKGDHVSYVPIEAGAHQIYITYGDLEVPGCPLMHSITDIGSIIASGNGLYRGEVQNAASFKVDCHGKKGELTIQVEGPNSIARVNIERDSNGHYVGTYIPLEVGTFKVNIQWNGRNISGAPFDAKIIDPRKVKVIGGWESFVDSSFNMNLTLKEEKTIKFDTSDAGQGVLSAEIKGDSVTGLIPHDLANVGNNLWILKFTPTVQGEYVMNITFGDVRINTKPIHGSIKTIDHAKVILTGKGLQTAKVKEQAEFVIDGTNAGPGKPFIKLTGVKSDIGVDMKPIDAHSYICTYKPTAAGAYLLDITWSDRQVQGSPFKITVMNSTDAAKVICTGEGLKTGIIGKEIKSTIDTRHAGPGELTASCDGPSIAAYVEIYDHRDGTYTLRVQPQEAGKHILNIKFDGEHVTGSPYTLKIMGPPDASKVRVRGTGVENGILPKFKSNFRVETQGAGAGQLTVRIRGPKGAFNVEMHRDSLKDRAIECRYCPAEIGHYIINVKWSEQHVPGSPFHVYIVDTQKDLEKLTADNNAYAKNYGTIYSNGSGFGDGATMDFNSWIH